MASAFTPKSLAAAAVFVRVVGSADVGQRDMSAFAREAFYDGGADAAASPRDEGSLVL
jgi:hypothetical protein